MPIDATVGRHGRGPTVDTWHCPRCGAEQVGPIGECHACGSGTAKGYHVDNPPLPPPTLPPLPEPGTWLVGRQAREMTSHQGFVAWADREGIGVGREQELAWRAWEAGRQWTAVRTHAAHTEPTVSPADAELSADRRTVIAALEKFIADVLVFEPEEVETGEWLSSTAANMLVMRLRKGEPL